MIKKSCNLIGWEHFGLYIFQEPEFSQIWDFCKNKANNKKFHYRTNSVKINDKIFQYIQKILFLAHFCPFSQFWGAKNFFLENPALSHTTSYGILASCQSLEKTNDTIPGQTEGWKDGQKDGRMNRPYFIGPVRLPPGVKKRPYFFMWSTILLFTSFSKTLLTTERGLTGWYFLAVDFSPTLSNTGTSVESFQQSRKQDSLRYTLKKSASMYGSSG